MRRRWPGVRSNANYEFAGSDHQCRVSFEKPSARARCLQQPAQGAAHDLFAIPVGPLEGIDAVCVRLIFFGNYGAVHPMIGTVLMLFFGLPARTRSL